MNLTAFKTLENNNEGLLWRWKTFKVESVQVYNIYFCVKSYKSYKSVQSMILILAQSLKFKRETRPILALALAYSNLVLWKWIFSQVSEYEYNI